MIMLEVNREFQGKFPIKKWIMAAVRVTDDQLLTFAKTREGNLSDCEFRPEHSVVLTGRYGVDRFELPVSWDDWPTHVAIASSLDGELACLYPLEDLVLSRGCNVCIN